METEQIVSLLSKKDTRGLEYLYDNYSAPLNGIVFRIVRCEKTSEEVLQQAFLKIWQKFDQFDESKASLFTWMARIARNAAIDRRRLKNFSNASITDSWEQHHDAVRTDNPDYAHIDTQKLLVSLEAKHREVVDCVYLEGYSQSEAANKLNIPLGTVKSRVRAAITQLREKVSVEKGYYLKAIIIFVCAMIGL